MKIEEAAQICYGWSPEKVKAVMDKNLLAEWDCELKIPGKVVPVTVRVFGEITWEDFGERKRDRVIENMRVTLNGTDVELGEGHEDDIANLILSE